jgi:hypothetical protein
MSAFLDISVSVLVTFQVPIVENSFRQNATDEALQNMPHEVAQKQNEEFEVYQIVYSSRSCSRLASVELQSVGR